MHDVIYCFSGPPVLDYERVVAMYEYNAQGPEELELLPGDLLVVSHKVDDVRFYLTLIFSLNNFLRM